MQINNLPILNRKTERNLDFIFGVFESHHVVDTIFECSLSIAENVLDTLVPLYKNKQLDSIGKLSNIYIFSFYEYIPYNVCEEISKKNPNKIMNTYSSVDSEDAAKHHKIYYKIKYDTINTDTETGNLMRKLPTQEEINNSVKSYVNNDDIYIDINSYVILVRLFDA